MHYITIFKHLINKYPKTNENLKIFEDKKNGLWSQYFKIYDEENTTDSKHSNSLAFYRQHKKEMDEGSEVLNPKRYKKSDGHISALQALMEKKHQIGDSAFFSEFQMEPKKFDYVVDITPRKIFLKNNKSVHSKTIPDGFLTTYLTMDLNTSYGITYNIVTYKPDSTCIVICHEIYKCQIDQALNELQYNQAVYNKISECIKHIQKFNIKIDGIGIDAGGKNFNVVCEFCKNCNSLFGIPAIAMAGRACTNFNPLVKSRLRNAVGRTVLCGDDREHVKSFSGHRYMFFDSDFFKEAVQKSLLAEVGAPGGCSLYNGLNIEHSDFAQQICNEILRFKKIKANGVVEFCWRSREPHDFLDTMAMSYAIACSNGISAEQQIVENNLTKEQKYKLLLLRKKKKIRII